MEHPIYHILGFEITAPYTLRIRFDDNTEQLINFEAILRGARPAHIVNPEVLGKTPDTRHQTTDRS